MACYVTVWAQLEASFLHPLNSVTEHTFSIIPQRKEDPPRILACAGIPTYHNCTSPL